MDFYALFVEQSFQFLPQPAKHPALGQVDGVFADAQLERDFRRRPTGHDKFPARLPGCRLKLRLHQLEGAGD